jgi:hypothetical protein
MAPTKLVGANLVQAILICFIVDPGVPFDVGVRRQDPTAGTPSEYGFHAGPDIAESRPSRSGRGETDDGEALRYWRAVRRSREFVHRPACSLALPTMNASTGSNLYADQVCISP